jgi:DNA-binding SARP family transcriptional activator
MEALERSGNVAEALRAYDRLRIMLRRELGIAPSPAVQDVHRRLLGSQAETTA